MEQIKERIKKAFDKSPKYELVEMPYIDCKEDPVRPELDLEFRQAYGRKIYGLKDSGLINSIDYFRRYCGRSAQKPRYGIALN